MITLLTLMACALKRSKTLSMRRHVTPAVSRVVVERRPEAEDGSP